MLKFMGLYLDFSCWSICLTLTNLKNRNHAVLFTSDQTSDDGNIMIKTIFGQYTFSPMFILYLYFKHC